MIYFITDTINIKIGYTKNSIEKRLKQLQTSNSNTLYLLGWIDGDMDFEKRLHSLFASSRIRSNGEWFKPTKDLIDYINLNNQKKNSHVDFVDGKLMSLFKLSI
jgi:hypothetical protein